MHFFFEIRPTMDEGVATLVRLVTMVVCTLVTNTPFYYERIPTQHHYTFTPIVYIEASHLGICPKYHKM